MEFATEVTDKLDDSAGSRHKEDIGAKCLQAHRYDAKYGISVPLKRLVLALSRVLLLLVWFALPR